MPDLRESYFIALNEAKREYGESELLVCTDIGDRFVFAIGYEGRSIKGASLITIGKHSGEIGYLCLPDDENFELLDKGVQVDITDISYQ